MARDRAGRPEAKPLRLFVAVDPPASALEVAEEAMRPWRERLAEARWVRPENHHVTLRFLGRTWPRLASFVESACRDTAEKAEPFQISLSGAGVFPGPTRARVLWVGLDDPTRGLSALAAGLDERLASEFPPEKRGFTAHLTVARIRQPVRVDRDELAATTVETPPFDVDRLLLYRSHLSPRGARYEVVGEYPLGG